MKQLSYSDIRGNSSRVLGLTGLKPEEFETLLAAFRPIWEDFIEHHTLEGKVRQRVVRRERKNAMLPTVEDKLLFILYEHKNYPTQEALATQFDMDQPHANVWLKILRPMLTQALSRSGDLPVRRAEGLDKAIGGRKRVVIDGVERPVLRSTDDATQREEYSGKKKTLREERAVGRR